MNCSMKKQQTEHTTKFGLPEIWIAEGRRCDCWRTRLNLIVLVYDKLTTPQFYHKWVAYTTYKNNLLELNIISIHFFTNITTFGYLPLVILQEFAGGLGSCCEKMQTQRARQEAQRIWYPVEFACWHMPVHICLLCHVLSWGLICDCKFNACDVADVAELYLLLRKATSKADMLFYCFLPSRYNQCGFGSVRFMSVCRYRFTHWIQPEYCVFCMPKAHTNQNTMYSCLTFFPTCQVRVSRF